MASVIHDSSTAELATREPYLDGLRGIAALMVVFYHSSLAIASEPIWPRFSELIVHLSRGVQLFFILSAFTLFHTSHLRWRQSGLRPLEFYIRRAFRILPLWWATCLLAMAFRRGEHTWSDFWATAFFPFGFSQDSKSIALLVGAWSIFVEESFYLLFPLWFSCLITKFWRSIAAAGVGFAVALLWWKWAYAQQLDSFFIATSPLANYPAFFLGIALYNFPEEWLARLRSQRVLSLHWFDLLALVCTAGIFFCERLAGTFLLIGPIFAARLPQTWLGHFVRMRWLGWFGTYCFSIYLLHPFIHKAIAPFQMPAFRFLAVDQAGLEIQSTVWFLVTAAICLAVGAVTFNWLERPCVELGKWVLSTWPRLFANHIANPHIPQVKPEPN